MGRPGGRLDLRDRHRDGLERLEGRFGRHGRYGHRFSIAAGHGRQLGGGRLGRVSRRPGGQNLRRRRGFRRRRLWRPDRPFLEGRKSGTIGLEANYQNKLVFDLSYTAFFGGEPYNQIADRDFASFTVKYSF